MIEELDYYVLDCLSDDIEGVEQILHMLNHEVAINWQRANGGPFQRDQVLPSLMRSIRRGHIEALVYSEDGAHLEEAGEKVLPNGDFDEHWFKLTARGRMLLSAWTPSVEPNDEVGRS